MTNSLNNAKKKIMALALTGALALTLIPAGLESADAASLTSLAAPTGIKTAARDDDELTLTWNAVEGAQGYEIYRYSPTYDKWIEV